MPLSKRGMYVPKRMRRLYGGRGMKCPKCSGEMKLETFKRVFRCYSNGTRQYARLECKDCNHLEVFN